MAAMISSRLLDTGSDSGNSMRSGVVVVKGKQSSGRRGGQTVDYRRAPRLLHGIHIARFRCNTIRK
ncbi:hypothetical protein ABL840_17170 [Variovorax sp. NFACC27]|uniref:hypothetical protein n=1 Tax=unclassified Variovorax TaxID=663243 RepID=UPI0015A10709|nr:hypothetical protein [Variovorax sp. YR750]MDP9600807.1 hypothetical protein [Variovorax paradoxus]